MALQLQDMFAGVRGGRGEVQGQASIEALAARVEKVRQLRDARRRQAPRIAAAICGTSGPETRITPTAPRPGALAMAAMVSWRGLTAT